MIYGTPALTIDDDQTDRIGIRTLVLSQLWQASRWPMPMAELDAEAPGVPEVPAGLFYLGRQTRRQGGVLRTAWTFEGVSGDGKDVTFRTRANSQDYRFEPGFAQVDLLLHPDFPTLLETYGGSVVDAEVTWPPTLGAAAAGSGLAGGSATQSRPNPLYGQRDFLRLEGTYVYRYAAFTLSGIESGVGKIHSSAGLPGRPPFYPGRNWLKAPVDYRARGPVFELSETYWLSGPGGWPEPLYGTAGAAEPTA